MNATSGAISSWPARWAGQGLPLLAAGLAGALCGVGFLQSWPVGLAVLLAMGIALVGLRHPLICWGGAVLAITVPHAVPEVVDTAIFWGLVTVFLMGWLVQQRTDRRRIELRDQRLWWCALSWLAVALVSTCQSIAPLESIKEMARYVLSFAALLAYLNWLRSEGQVRGMLGWLQGSAGLVAVVAVVAGWWRLHTGLDPSRLGWANPNPVELSVLLTALIPVSVSLVWTPGARRRWPQLLFLGAAGAALALIGSRASALAILTGVVVVCWWRSRRRFYQALLATGLVGLVLLAPLRSHDGSLRAGLIASLSGREQVWRAAGQAIAHEPFLGIGPGAWSTWFGQQFSSADFLRYDAEGNSSFDQPATLQGEAHNLFLTKAAEMGLPSVLLLAALLVFWAQAARRSMRRLPEGWVRAAAIGSLASLCGLLAYSLFEHGPLIGRARGVDVIVVWWLAALPLVASRLIADPGR
ncbi:MAG: O-antigen ligase family protein [Candidatus Omnitrophica bacterium]|nr:O-antigen ligase family protein [Candidatus Omnitrophota bacterium]